MVVGVTEQMEEFIAVLEATIPSFFKGALKLYREGFPFSFLPFIKNSSVCLW